MFCAQDIASHRLVRLRHLTSKSNKADKPRKMNFLSSSNGPTVPASFKSFWKKTKKNKSRGTSDVISTVIEEARDEELEMRLPHQTGNSVVTASSPSMLEATPMTTVHDASVEIRDDIESSKPSNEEPSKPPVSANKTEGEISETQDDTIANHESSTTDNNSINRAISESTTKNNSIDRSTIEERVVAPKQTQRNTTTTSRHTGQRATL